MLTAYADRHHLPNERRFIDPQIHRSLDGQRTVRAHIGGGTYIVPGALNGFFGPRLDKTTKDISIGSGVNFQE
jgi:hypothetical protein